MEQDKASYEVRRNSDEASYLRYIMDQFSALYHLEPELFLQEDIRRLHDLISREFKQGRMVLVDTLSSVLEHQVVNDMSYRQLAALGQTMRYVRTMGNDANYDNQLILTPYSALFEPSQLSKLLVLMRSAFQSQPDDFKKRCTYLGSNTSGLYSDKRSDVFEMLAAWAQLTFSTDSALLALAKVIRSGKDLNRSQSHFLQRIRSLLWYRRYGYGGE